MSEIRLACIGCGFIGRRHLENVQAMNEVSAIAHVDLRQEAAAAFQQEFGGRYHSTRAERVFEDTEIDAVLICTHHDSHTALAVQAAESGKHILLEKPMALSVAECQEISRAVERAGVVLSLNFKFRLTPAVLKAKEYVQQPIATVGQLCMNPLPRDSWVRDPERGGGLILATGCHVLDLIYWLNESEPVQVFAQSQPHPDSGGNVRAAVATVRFQNGALASLLLADAGETSFLGKWPHQLYNGQRSAVLYNHFRSVHLSGDPPQDFHTPDSLQADGTYAVLEQFVNAIRSGVKPSIDARDGLRATLLGRRLLDSLNSGQPEQVQFHDLD